MNFSLYKDLFFALRFSRKIQLCVVVALMVLAALLEVISIGAVVPVIQTIVGEEVTLGKVYSEYISHLIKQFGYEPRLAITIFFVAIFVFASIVRVTMVVSLTRIAHGVGADIAIEIFDRSLSKTYLEHIAISDSESVAMLTMKVNGLINQTVLPILFLISSSIIISFVVLGVFLISPQGVFVLVATFFVIYIMVYFFVRPFLIKAGARLEQSTGDTVAVMSHAYSSFVEILLGGHQRFFRDRYAKVEKERRFADAIIQIIAAFPRYLIEAVGIVVLVLVAFFYIDEKSRVSGLSTVAMFALAAQRILPLAQQVYASISSLRGGAAILFSVLRSLSYSGRVDLYQEESRRTSDPSWFQSIRLEGVGFSYGVDNYAHIVLRDINLTIEKGRVIGIIGESGSGKSTLLKIIMGLIPPTSGGVSVNGLAISENRDLLKRYQSAIGYVPQSVRILDASIAENIAFAEPSGLVDLQRVHESARFANLDARVNRLPKHYQTLVGAGGVKLSGGEMQRLAIARAAYRSPVIYALDEATSAQDHQNEHLLLQSLGRRDKETTFILVTHRPTLLEACDTVFELNNGSLKKVR